MNEYRKIKQEPLEKLILLGIQGVHFHSYADTLNDRYFSISDICLFGRNVNTLEDFENEYGVNIINIVLDGE